MIPKAQDAFTQYHRRRLANSVVNELIMDPDISDIEAQAELYRWQIRLGFTASGFERARELTQKHMHGEKVPERMENMVGTWSYSLEFND